MTPSLQDEQYYEEIVKEGMDRLKDKKPSRYSKEIAIKRNDEFLKSLPLP